MSPSGNSLAVLLTMDGQRQIMVFDRDFTLINRIELTNEKFRRLSFVGDHAILFAYSTTIDLIDFTADQLELWQVVIIPLDPTQPAHRVFADERGIVNGIFGMYGVRETPAGWRGYFGAVEFGRTSFGAYRFDHGRPALYEVDLATMEMHRVAESARENHDLDWLLDETGQVVAAFDVHTGTGAWTIVNAADSVIASGSNPSGRAGVLGLGADGQSVIYYAVDPATESPEWFEVPLTGGASVPFLADVDVDRLLWNPLNGRLLGYIPDSEEDSRPVLYDREIQTRARLAVRSLAERNGELAGWASDFNRVLMHTSGSSDSGTWIFMDLAGRSAREIGYDRPRIAPASVGPVSVVHYTAADGLELDGVLTLPPGREPLGLPVIMMPHGGPVGHDEPGFDWWAQAFAARGYAVFQPNFRGSSGRGDAFIRAGFGQWGRLMQTDISDGLAHLAAQGTVDPARACIVGASYGGYAALAGVTVQQGLYRCAAAVAGVSDIAAMYAAEYRETGRMRTVRASLLDQLGPRESWAAVSPRRLAARADAPILLVHGRDDTVVPYSHSTAMADALRDAGKSVRLVELAGEDHWLSRSETRQQMLQATMDFVLEHNPPE